jgi:hypothetical protein
MMSLPCHQSCVRTDYVGDNNHAVHTVLPSTALAFVTKVREKYKPTSPGAIQVKNQGKTISTEDKRDVVSPTEKG